MLPQLIEWLMEYRYLVVLPIAVIEGPVLALVCGFLMRVDFFAFWPIYLLLMAGDLVSDIYWYYIGRWGGRRFLLKFGRFFSITEEKIDIVERLYHRHYNKILFFSKITMGFGFAVAIVAVAGLVKVPFKKYISYNLLGQPIWTGLLLTVGYFLGEFYLTFSKGFEAISLVAIIIMAGAALWGFGTYMRKRMLNKYS